MKILKSFVLLLAFTALTTIRAHAQEAAGQTAPATNKPAAKSDDLFGNILVAKGKGVEVKRSQLDEAMISIKAGYAARGQVLPPEQTSMLEQRLLDRLIQLQLFNSRATDADKVKATETVEKRLADAKQRSGDEVFNRQIKSTGMSVDEIKTKMTEEALLEIVVKRELPVNLTEEDAKKYYEANTARFEQPETVRASHVLISTTDPATRAELPEDKKAEKRKLAEEVLKKAKAGEDFAKLARDYSEDPGSKEKGGEYTFPRGQMVKEFEAAAFSLNTNQVSDIVTTQFGYHIIKLSEKLPAKKEPFAGLETKTIYRNNEGQNITIRDIMTDEALQKQFQSYYAKLKQDAGIEILDERLKPKDTPALPPPVKPESKK
jgi:parvulin-like peptidyl-prolyl isomerase